jgi:predicted ATP-grasp superfamily ATP-dependent carboligase
MSELGTHPTSIAYNPVLIGTASLDASVEKQDRSRFPRGLKGNQIIEALISQWATADVEVYSFLTFYLNYGSSSILKDLIDSFVQPIQNYLTTFDAWPIIAITTAFDPTARIRAKIERFPDKVMATQAIRILDDVRRILSDAVDIDELPPIRTFANEDGSLLIEWMSPHWRIGFSIERDNNESGWYLVSDESYGDVRAYGNLNSVDVKWLVTWALARLT